MTPSKLKVPLIIFFSALILVAGLYFGGSSFVPELAGSIKIASTETTVSRDSSLVGARAPYFDLPNLSGAHMKLTDSTDSPLLIVFWSTWNNEATDQIKILDDFLSAQKNNEAEVRVIAIDSQEEKSIVSSFMRRGGYTVPIVLDVQGIVSNAYGVTGLPTMFFVDRGRVIRDILVGGQSQRVLVEKIEKILR